MTQRHAHHDHGPSKLDLVLALYTDKPGEHAPTCHRGLLTAEERDVLVSMLLRRNPQQHDRCDPTLKTIAADTLLSVRTVQRAIDALGRKGYVVSYSGKAFKARNSYRVLWGAPSWREAQPQVQSVCQIGQADLQSNQIQERDPCAPTPRLLPDQAVVDQQAWDLSAVLELALDRYLPHVEVSIDALWDMGRQAAEAGLSRAHVMAGVLSARHQKATTIGHVVTAIAEAANCRMPKRTAKTCYIQATKLVDASLRDGAAPWEARTGATYLPIPDLTALTAQHPEPATPTPLPF